MLNVQYSNSLLIQGGKLDKLSVQNQSQIRSGVLSTFVDVALPAAVRRQFTYHVPDELGSQVQEGQRVWIPFRNYYAIGVIVRVHDETPSFKTKPVRKVLDEEPLLSKELLELTGWISKFYYASWGETIQAALPAGLNFVSRKYLNVADAVDYEILSDEEQEVVTELRENKTTLDEAKSDGRERD